MKMLLVVAGQRPIRRQVEVDVDDVEAGQPLRRLRPESKRAPLGNEASFFQPKSSDVLNANPSAETPFWKWVIAPLASERSGNQSSDGTPRVASDPTARTAARSSAARRARLASRTTRPA